MKKVEAIRKKIMRKDREIVRLLNERGSLSVEIGRIKGDMGMAPYDPAQEARLFGGLAELNQGPLSDESLRNIYREVVSSSRELEIRRAGWFVLGALPPLLALAYFKFALVPPNDMISEFDPAAVWKRIADPARYLEIGAAVVREAIFQLHLPLLAAYLLFSGVSIR